MQAVIDATVALTLNRCLSFVYDDKPRILEVHAIGASTKDGSALIRGFQVAGESSRPLPCWALFRADEMKEIEVLDDLSLAPRVLEGYALNDKQMNPVYIQVSIDPS